MSNNQFLKHLQQRILIFDGAMGTMLQEADLSIEDFGGPEYEGCNEYLNLTSPQVIEWIHRSYLEAGADIIETNSFGGTPVVLDEYDLGHKAYEINRRSAELAAKVVEEFSTDDHPRFVAGALGPTTKTLSVTGGITFEQLVEDYETQAKGLIDGGSHLLLLETSQDTLNVKAGYLGIQRAQRACKKSLPLIISGTIEPMGTTLAGQNIESFYISIEHMQPVAIGLNCATGPEFMTDHIRSLSNLADCAVHCYPNAGLPDEEGNYHETPQSLAAKLKAFAEKGWLNIVGGCCGTTPDHIRAIKDAVKDIKPRIHNEKRENHQVSGIEPLIYDDTMRPLFVGERTNVIGSKKFRELIVNEKYEEAAEIARKQVKNGAHVIDICLANPDRDELTDMEQFMKQVTQKVKVPLVIDSTDEQVIEKSLKYSQGKAIINSINLEDGIERFEKTLPIIKQYGAAVVVGTIDEEGMAVTAERKLAVAKRCFTILVNEHNISPSDIIFDPLVFPVGTGDEAYIGAAKETVEGIRLIKEELPECLTILGVSNVSFGLPPAGREVLNAVFLYHCTRVGLDYAIVNTEKLERFASIPEDEVILSEKLLFETNDKILADFTAHYRGKKTKQVKVEKNLSLPERLANYIVEGTKEGLLPDLELALDEYDKPLDIINGPLMTGMAEVGRLFNDNQLIVAEVLQSAEVMKASVTFLEDYMEATDNSGKKGKIVLATVKGDVHDIGKNLVEIILSNNGFEVIDLGIKVTPSELISVVQKEQPDIIGLSGLLVKSAQQMVLTAQDLKQANISIPILVGGAALSRKFTENKIAGEYDGHVLYAKDAMNGLSLANDLNNGEIPLLPKTKATTVIKQESNNVTSTLTKVRSNVATDVQVFVPNDMKRHVLKDYDLSQIQPYINLQMLLGHHLGLKGKIKKLLEEGNSKVIELKALVDDLLIEAKREKFLKAAAVYQFFPAQAEGDDVIVYDPNNHSHVLKRFTFPRQHKKPYLCLADYLRPVSSGEMDYVGFMTVTAGIGVRNKADQLKSDGEFLKNHALQALALETAEGLAERVHQLIRDNWGFPDSVEMTMQDRFSARYQGQRFSFGYPACPNLEDQELLFDLLHPEDIGVQLTDGFMMQPEASVSAIVFAHPEARYFNVN
ncbi:methionine synthase [Bacillus solimangrovi]|uniref:Methionine synthase n=1 Tax=Bacillus solimangrovi TaxID=1305675 RepID=A0A1E5LC50_9BACI|nr:methionine synthase [Bacillus solimangrovi]OEH91656.1 methionine synthase [Bacillus solimangrovi]